MTGTTTTGDVKIDDAAAAAAAAAANKGDATERGGTILEGDKGGGTGDTKPKVTWPENWHEAIAAGDEKLSKSLKQFKTPDALAKSYAAMRQRMSSGELRSTLPENASPEQMAEWRAENGIPENPDGYELPKVNGFEWTEDDKPALNEFLSVAHKNNIAPKAAQEMLTWYASTMAAAETQQFEADTNARVACEDALRVDWGAEYRGNIALIKRFIETDYPGGLDAALARGDDGVRLIDSTEFAGKILAEAKERYGDATMIGGDGTSTVANKKAFYQKLMRDDREAYTNSKEPNGKTPQQNYLDLLEREEQMSKRGRAA